MLTVITLPYPKTNASLVKDCLYNRLLFIRKHVTSLEGSSGKIERKHAFLCNGEKTRVYFERLSKLDSCELGSWQWCNWKKTTHFLCLLSSLKNILFMQTAWEEMLTWDMVPMAQFTDRFWLCIEIEMSSFWWNFHNWLHWKLSKWQLPMQLEMKFSLKWWHFRINMIRIWWECYYSVIQTIERWSLQYIVNVTTIAQASSMSQKLYWFYE